jgi:hypothetical protein
VVTAHGTNLAWRHDRRARHDVYLEVLAQPPLASPRIRARVGGHEDRSGAQPKDLCYRVPATHDELAAERFPEIGERLEQESCSVRASEQSVVEYKERNDLLETLRCRSECGIVVYPKVAAENDDSDGHQRSEPNTSRMAEGTVTKPRRWRSRPACSLCTHAAPHPCSQALPGHWKAATEITSNIIHTLYKIYTMGLVIYRREHPVRRSAEAAFEWHAREGAI